MDLGRADPDRGRAVPGGVDPGRVDLADPGGVDSALADPDRQIQLRW